MYLNYNYLFIYLSFGNYGHYKTVDGVSDGGGFFSPYSIFARKAKPQKSPPYPLSHTNPTQFILSFPIMVYIFMIYFQKHYTI